MPSLMTHETSTFRHVTWLSQRSAELKRDWYELRVHQVDDLGKVLVAKIRELEMRS